MKKKLKSLTCLMLISLSLTCQSELFTVFADDNIIQAISGAPITTDVLKDHDFYFDEDSNTYIVDQDPDLDLRFQIYNPIQNNKSLTQLLELIMSGNDNDKDISDLYIKAIKEDPFLLTGIQIDWAYKKLSEAYNNSSSKIHSNNLCKYIILLGLSGNKEVYQLLLELKNDGRLLDNNSRNCLKWSLSYINQYGRLNQDIISASNTSFQEALVYPTSIAKIIDLNSIFGLNKHSYSIKLQELLIRDKKSKPISIPQLALF